jgi:hypothetical protein
VFIALTDLVTFQVSASLLSHYQEGFALGASWLLFFVGLFNVVIGIAFRSRLKLRRSLFRSKRQLSEKRDLEKGADVKENLWSLAHTSLGNKLKRKSNAKVKTVQRERESLLKSPIVKPIRTPLDAFPRSMQGGGGGVQSGASLARTTSTLSPASELLRKRARQENWLIEKQQEEVEKEKGIFSSQAGLGRQNSNMSVDTTAARIKQGQAGANDDLNGAVTPREQGVRAAFQRRSLVLSKMVQQVKRGSMSMAGKKRAKRVSKIPPLPNRYAKQLLIPKDAPSAWIEIEKSQSPPHMPSATYRPERTTIYEDLGHGGTGSHYHSFAPTPIADQYSYRIR